MSRTGFTYSLLKCSVFAIIGKTTIYKLHKTHPFAFKIKIALMMISCCGFDEEKCAFPVRYVVCSDAPAHLFLLSFVVARYLLTFNSIPVCTLVWCTICRVGQNLIYTVYVRHFCQGNYQIYGNILCIYTVLANPYDLPRYTMTDAERKEANAIAQMQNEKKEELAWEVYGKSYDELPKNNRITVGYYMWVHLPQLCGYASILCAYVRVCLGQLGESLPIIWENKMELFFLSVIYFQEATRSFNTAKKFDYQSFTGRNKFILIFMCTNARGGFRQRPSLQTFWSPQNVSLFFYTKVFYAASYLSGFLNLIITGRSVFFLFKLAEQSYVRICALVGGHTNDMQMRMSKRTCIDALARTNMQIPAGKSIVQKKRSRTGEQEQMACQGQRVWEKQVRGKTSYKKGGCCSGLVLCRTDCWSAVLHWCPTGLSRLCSKWCLVSCCCGWVGLWVYICVFLWFWCGCMSIALPAHCM